MRCQSWRTREDGVVVVIPYSGAPEQVPTLSAFVAAGTDRIPSFDRAVERYEPICDEIGEAQGLRRGWLLAVGWREGGWQVRAFRQEPKRSDEVEGWTGIGPMQITHPSLKRRHKVQVGTVMIDGAERPLWQWQGGLSDEELYDLRLNVEIGAAHLRELVDKYGHDFPRVSAAYNAGSVRATEDNAWCMVQTAGHVSAEVAALNYYLLRDERRAAERAAAVQFGVWELLGDGFDRPAGLDENERITLPEIPDELATRDDLPKVRE